MWALKKNDPADQEQDFPSYKEFPDTLLLVVKVSHQEL
jgi:hypothetical protein